LKEEEMKKQELDRANVNVSSFIC